jgi:hypothetical protein
MRRHRRRSLTVTPEPSGGLNSLNAGTLSSKPDTLITCSNVDDRGVVPATRTGSGAYASCDVSTMNVPR